MSRSRFIQMVVTYLSAALASLALFSPAAAARDPAPGYEQFAGCPSPKESPATTSCQRATITGGHIQVGGKTVPIVNPVVISGGTDPAGKDFEMSPRGGLSKRTQRIPGGIIGVPGLTWLTELLVGDAFALHAVAELVGPPELTTSAYELPLGIRLINPMLGDSCHVGSSTNPIHLKLSVGTTDPPPPNAPITGVSPTPTQGATRGVGILGGGVFVDNAFAAPAARGCELRYGDAQLAVDTLVNSVAGLPSQAGANEARLDFDLEIVSRRLVYPSGP